LKDFWTSSLTHPTLFDDYYYGGASSMIEKSITTISTDAAANGR
jgi:hypothetical protein